MILDRGGDKAELVHFIDVTVEPNKVDAKLLPTIVYVDDCADPQHIQYLFGYEARKKIEAGHYESIASVFYEIKRWLTSPDELEPIRDEKNHKASPKRKEIIKAYTDYVIGYAEQYFSTRFHKIHLSAPVKLKEQVISTFTELYRGEKEIVSVEDSIDEGLAIVYNQIVSMSDRQRAQQTQSIMIMDCGGGTTDLASCEFRYHDTLAGKMLELDTCFENGNSNFGGNNITYRIMQLLKIKLASRLNPDLVPDSDISVLIDKSESEILGHIEQGIGMGAYNSDLVNEDVYGQFLAAYERAEEVIPTRFENNPNYRLSSQRKMIRRNFHYLWRLAEKTKIEFFRNEEQVLIDFQDKEETVILVSGDDNYYLYIADGGAQRLRKIARPFEEMKISITIREINRVICGDIYSLLVGMFHDGAVSTNGKMVDQFDYYKLSGQSCKISLFTELIKEYIPGRKLRPVRGSGGAASKKRARNSEDLKLDCIRGCISYIQDQNRPEMQVQIRSRFHEVIYDVYLKQTHKAHVMLLDHSQIQVIQTHVCPVNTRELPLQIVNQDGTPERELIVQLPDWRSDGIAENTEAIRARIRETSIIQDAALGQFLQRLTRVADEQRAPSNLIALLPANHGYGFYLAHIYIASAEDRNVYKLLKYEYYTFEDASKTFFDGRR